MPNHISNTLRLLCDEDTAREVWELIGSSDKRLIDFELIIPVPEHIFRGDLNQETKDRLGEENTWLGWCPENWGTKWNAYDQCRLDEYAIYFETAWDPPKPIFLKIAEMFPRLAFQVIYCNEDSTRKKAGGFLTYANGKEVSRYEVGGPSGTQLLKYLESSVQEATK